MTDEQRTEKTSAGATGDNGSTSGAADGEDWKARALRAEAALAEALAERNRLWEELNRRNAQADELEHYRRLTAMMEGSASWRLTRPVRDAKRVAIAGRASGRQVTAKIRGKLRESR